MKNRKHKQVRMITKLALIGLLIVGSASGGVSQTSTQITLPEYLSYPDPDMFPAGCYMPVADPSGFCARNGETFNWDIEATPNGPPCAGPNMPCTVIGDVPGNGVMVVTSGGHTHVQISNDPNWGCLLYVSYLCGGINWTTTLDMEALTVGWGTC